MNAPVFDDLICRDEDGERLDEHGIEMDPRHGEYKFFLSGLWELYH